MKEDQKEQNFDLDVEDENAPTVLEDPSKRARRKPKKGRYIKCRKKEESKSEQEIEEPEEVTDWEKGEDTTKIAIEKVTEEQTPCILVLDSLGSSTYVYLP